MTTTTDTHRLAVACGGLVAALLLTSCAAGRDQASPAAPPTTPAAAPSTDAPVPRASPITATPTPRVAAPTTAAPASDVLLPPPAVDYGDPRAVADAYTRARGRYTWTDTAGYARAQTAAELATPTLAARSAPDPTAVDQLVTAQETSGVTAIATTPTGALAGQPPANDATTYVTCTFSTAVTYRGAAGPDVEDQVWTLRLQRGADSQWRVDAVTAATAADPVEDD